MRTLLFGKFGQLGWELQRCLGCLGEVLALDYPEIDLQNPASVREWVRKATPDLIVNATAYTAVDKAESELDVAMAINAHSVGVLAEEAERQRAALIHFSTDYVFDGNKGSPYVEDDIPNPLNIYGQSKLAGERLIQESGDSYLILRTSWVYSLRRENFVTRILDWARNRTSLRVVDDQVGNPTWARALAEVTAMLLARVQGEPYLWIKERKGIYHLAGSGIASRYEWAQAILESDPHQKQQTVQEILPAKSADFPTPARRPLYSALNCDKFQIVFNLQLPPWQEALKLALEDL